MRKNDIEKYIKNSIFDYRNMRGIECSMDEIYMDMLEDGYKITKKEFEKVAKGIVV